MLLTDFCEEIEGENTTYSYYDKDARLLDKRSNSVCAARCVTRNSSTFFVKTFKGVLYNPVDGLASTSYEITKSWDSPWRMMKVPKSIFDDYMTFLRSHNPVFVRRAQRALINQTDGGV